MQLIVKPLLALSTVVLWKGVDQGVIDGTVNGAGSASKGIVGELRRIQSGNIRSYAAWVAVGGAAVIAYMIWIGVTNERFHPHSRHLPADHRRSAADADAA